MNDLLNRAAGALLAALIPATALAQPATAKDPAVSSIGGRWRILEGDQPKYFYQDGDRLVDLFAYHALDSNQDGVPNVRISHDANHLILRSQGYPNHPTAVFPNTDNPNSIRVQDFTFRLPLQPKKADRIARLPMGPIGTALNGVVFFNPFEIGGMNAVEGYSEVWLDSCCGHPQQTGVYHYHKYPSCLKSPFPDDGSQHSPIIGFAFDGFPIYGPFESKNQMALDLKGDRALDACNGHADRQRGYHYHVTPNRFPYVIGGYAGVVERSNLRGMRRLGIGAIADNASGESRLPKVLDRVTPGVVSRGGTREIRITLDTRAARRELPQAAPDWVQIGPYEAVSIRRDKDVILAKFEIPEDASLGVLLDVHVEFRRSSDRRPLVFKKNNVLRVLSQEEMK